MATIAFVFLLELVTGERESSIEAIAGSPVAEGFLVTMYYIGWWVLGTFLYHTIYQLRVIRLVYAEHIRVTIFVRSPLYAFSGVTALTAVTLAVATYGWTALNPDNLSNPLSIVILSLITVLALAVFFWPLLGVQRLMAKVRAEKLDEVSLRQEAAFARLHQRIDGEMIEEIANLLKIISALETERDVLKSMSTWPWQPETLRFLVSALFLPLLLWIVQYVLQLVLAFS